MPQFELRVKAGTLDLLNGAAGAPSAPSTRTRRRSHRMIFSTEMPRYTGLSDTCRASSSSSSAARFACARAFAAPHRAVRAVQQRAGGVARALARHKVDAVARIVTSCHTAASPWRRAHTRQRATPRPWCPAVGERASAPAFVERAGACLGKHSDVVLLGQRVVRRQLARIDRDARRRLRAAERATAARAVDASVGTWSGRLNTTPGRDDVSVARARRALASPTTATARRQHR